MNKTRVALFGGTRLTQGNVEFVGNLVDAFLKNPGVVLVTGGFWHHDSDREVADTSVDLATLRAVEAYSAVEQVPLSELLETWLAEKPRPDVARFSKGEVRKLKGSSRARRFQLVQEVDAIVTISGHEHTATVLEVALAIGKPILPIGFTGGDSAAFWDEDKEHFVEWLQIPAELATQLGEGPSSGTDTKQLADEVAVTLLKNARRRCLVLMGFGGANDAFFDSVLSPTIKSSGFEPHRLDRHDDAGNITELFLSRVTDSQAIVVDITGLNPNVMYELGHIHHHATISPVIVTRDAIKLEDLPFYLRQHVVIVVGSDKQIVADRIARQLALSRKKRAPSWKVAT